MNMIILIPLFSPLCIGIIKKIKAIFQNRIGASIFQPYRDLWKLFHKDEVISRDASWIFKLAPFIIFAVTLVAGANFNGDILLIIYTLAIGTFFLALAGMDTGSAFGGFGSSREMTVSALAEGGFIFSLLTISNINLASHGQSFLPGILAFAGFFIVLLAETARFPFDNPATHLELTMIHESMILEYSGKRLALMEWASFNKFLIFCFLGANLFFHFGFAFIPIIIFAFCFAVGFIESTMAKFRFFRLPDLLIISFIFNVVAIGLMF